MSNVCYTYMYLLWGAGQKNDVFNLKNSRFPALLPSLSVLISLNFQFYDRLAFFLSEDKIIEQHNNQLAYQISGP